MGSTQLALLPDKQQLAEVNNRIKVMLPGGAKLSNDERFALAQIAVVHGLDPFNGEVWYIPGRGPMIGIKGLRKKAREQVHGNFWIDFREIMDEAERKRYGIEAGALAFLRSPLIPIIGPRPGIYHTSPLNGSSWCATAI